MKLFLFMKNHFKQLNEFISNSSIRRSILYGLILAVIIELICCIMRFGLGLESTRDTAFLAGFTLGLRIHHGYIGGLFLGMTFPGKLSRWRNILIIIGLGLFVSDLIHHFGILWPVTGRHYFDLFYPS